MMARYAAPILEALERLSRPRLLFILPNDRVIGIACFYLSLLLLLPIPFLNTAPAICLVTIALGLIHRDGLLVALGIAGTILITTTIVFITGWVTSQVLPHG